MSDNPFEKISAGLSARQKVPLERFSQSFAKARGVIRYQGEGTVVMRGAGIHDYCCGFCGAVLNSGVEDVKFQNAAAICNNCKNISSLSRSARYSPSIKHLRISSREIGYVEGLMPASWPRMKHSDKLEGVYQNIVSDISRHQGDRPRLLYHYTSPQGLVGIVSSGRFWATNANYLNDTQELVHAQGLIRTYIDEISLGLSEAESEIVRRAIPNVIGGNLVNDVYVTCFCEEGDLLSQWRAYAGNGSGYSVGIDAFHIGQYRDVGKSVILRKVIYDPDMQRSLVRSVVDATLKHVRENYDSMSIKNLDDIGVLPTISSFLGDSLTEFCLYFKHQAFSEEREWRAISLVDREDDLESIKLRVSGNLLAPYVETSLSSYDEDYPILPIAEVFCGPTLADKLTEDSVHLLLHKHDQAHVEVRRSSAPYRT